jgi:2'-5' RNA ligase
MDIKTKLREALLKEGAHKDKKGNSYGCVMVFLDYDKSEWKKIQDIIDDDDLYEPKDETGFGREKEPHVTILYGLHDDIEDKDIADEVDKIKTPGIKLGKVSSFENDKFDVLKFDVVSSDLHELNKEFKEFPHTSTFPKYEPHSTIAYVKKGKAKEYIDKLNKAGKIEVKPDKIVYSKANGEKKNYKI